MNTPQAPHTTEAQKLTPKNYAAVREHILSCESASLSPEYCRELVNSFDALTEANKKLLQHVRDISSVVSFVGCEGSGDAICIDAEMAREDWCPMCRIGECVNAALKVMP